MWIALTLSLAACAPAALPPLEYPEPGAADDLRIEGELVQGERTCTSGTGIIEPCDRLDLAFDRHVTAYLTVHTAVPAIHQPPGDGWEPVGATEGTEVTYRRRVDPGRRYRALLWVTPRQREERVGYRVTVRPMPSEHSAPRRNPVRTVDWEARREEVLGGRPLAEFTRRRGDLERHVREVLTPENGIFPFGEPIRAEVAQLADLPVELAGDRCYWFVFRLRSGGWSELVRRGAQVRLDTGDGRPNHVSLDGFHDAGINRGGLCAATSATARLSVYVTRLDGGPYAHELADGQVTVHVYGRSQNAFGYTAEEFAAVARSSTRGLRAAGTLATGDLSRFGEVPMQIQRGTCYVLVLRLGDGADWSAGAREHGVREELRLPDESIVPGPGVRGPGGVFDAGCPLNGGPGVFTLRTRDGVLGQGPFRLELYTRAARAGELRQQEIDDCEAGVVEACRRLRRR